MPIILAIEPDRRQAAQLTAIVRRRVGAELILADTTEAALDAIGNRVPDMVLVPALLSPQDDASLAAALRVIAAAAHVRTLTIPVLSSGDTRSAQGGILSRWLRPRARTQASEGCDPAVFAEQITAYLKEAAAERTDLDLNESVAIAPMVESSPGAFATPEADSVEAPVELPWLSAEAIPVGLGSAAVEPVGPPVELAWLTVEASSVRLAPPVVNPVQTPVELVTRPVEAVEPPIEFVALVTEASPIELVTPPVEAVEQPIELVALVPETSPVELVTPPVEAVEPPIELVAPVTEASPIELVAPPVEAVEAPVELVALVTDPSPVELVTPPVETVEAPVETVDPLIELVALVAEASPIELVTPPVEAVEAPVELVALVTEASPIELVAPPVETVEPPLELVALVTEAPPVELIAPPVETVEPPVELAALLVEASPVDLGTPVVEPFALALAVTPTAADDDDGTIDLSADLTFLSSGEDNADEPAAHEVMTGEPAGVYTIDTSDWEVTPVADAAVVEEAIAEQAVAEKAVAEEALSDEAAYWLADLPGETGMSLASSQTWPALDGVQAEALIVDEERPVEPTPVAGKQKPLEWSELVASLRQDIERRRTKPVAAAEPQAAKRPANLAAIRRSQPDTRQKPHVEEEKPLQDEWGFFDPQKCGFAALLAKLEQVTVTPDPTDNVRRSA